MPTEVGECCCGDITLDDCACDEEPLLCEALPTGWDIDLSAIVSAILPAECAVHCDGGGVTIIAGCLDVPGIYRLETLTGCEWEDTFSLVDADDVCSLSMVITHLVTVFETGGQKYVCHTLGVTISDTSCSFANISCDGIVIDGQECDDISGNACGIYETTFIAKGIFPVGALEDCYQTRNLTVTSYTEPSGTAADYASCATYWGGQASLVPVLRCSLTMPTTIEVEPFT